MTSLVRLQSPDFCHAARLSHCYHYPVCVRKLNHWEHQIWCFKWNNVCMKVTQEQAELTGVQHQASSSMLCRFALWFSGRLWFSRAPQLCNTSWLIAAQTALYELINSTAWLFIIGLEVCLVMHQTRAKINNWKWFMCATLLCCCCCWTLGHHQNFPAGKQSDQKLPRIVLIP